ncbi:MAG: FAD-dependent oxidoreductase [Moraxellaceae bacterium]|nr:MAG: FAD-dependent oxidoreductase [Moraxellaceae bacterium]
MMKIAIIGCGPAGLSCALQFAKYHHQITIFERMSSLAMQGSGVTIQPVGLAALDIIGVRTEVERYGQPILSIVGRSGERNRLSVHVDYSQLNGINYALGLHRGALFNVLYREVRKSCVRRYRCCHRLTSF